jgi:Zn finger protein HypA/HybF involved in hydrogenase expression
MTQIEKLKIKCHLCRTEYEGLIVNSWNVALSGQFPKDEYKLSCPNCNVPYKNKTNPNI